MPPRLLQFIGNAILPGSALVLAGRMTVGLLLLLPALGCLGLLLLGLVLTGGALWEQTRLIGLVGYAILAALADLTLWLHGRRPTVDAEAAQRSCTAATAAWLGDRHDEAVAAARELCRLTPHLPGAWKLLARCAGDAGQPQLATKARKRAQRLLDQAAG